MPTNKPGTTPVIQPPVKYVRREPEPRIAERCPRPPSLPPPQSKPVTVWRVMKYALASTLLAIVMGVVMLALLVADPLEGGGDSQADAEVEGPPHLSSPGRNAPDRFSTSE